MTEENDADTTEETQEEPTAGSEEGELSVPKHRLDELAGRLRRTEEALQQKDQVIRDVVAQRQPQQQADREPTAEELGIEPEVLDVFRKETKRAVAKKEKEFASAIGHVLNDLEETKFIHRWPDADLEAVKAYKDKNFRVTGEIMSLDQAMKGLDFDLRAAGVKKPAKKAAKKVEKEEKVEEKEEVNTPDSKATNGDSGSSGMSDKSFEEQTLEEMEANLDSQLPKGAVI